MVSIRRWADYPLKTKMFSAFSAASLFIALLTCLIFYYKDVDDMKSQTYDLSQTISKQFNRTFEMHIEDIEKLSLSIFSDPAIQSSLLEHYNSKNPVKRNEIDNILNSRLLNHAHPRPYVQSIYIFTLDGHVFDVSKGNSLRLDYGLKDEIWYPTIESAFKDRKFLLLPTQEEDTIGDKREKVVSFVRNINRIPTREIIGYMKININVEALENILVSSESNELERSMRIFIMTNEGEIVYDLKNELTGEAASGIGASIFNQSSLSGELKWSGKNYLYTYEKSAYTNWNTLILIPNDFILSKQNEIRYIVVIIGIIAMLIIAAVSYLLAHQITLPLRKLMSKMNRVELGDFSQRMEAAGNNEFGRLSHIYNNMLDSISRLINEVYESKIAEKNAQLSALQAQINPHFLYNTLNTMKSISRIRGIEEVVEISESLADLFKYSMKNLQDPVTLRDEMNHIQNYMSIQRHRFGNRFELQCDISDDLMDASVLKLIIQPLIENAVIHGLGKMKIGGIIKISALLESGNLIIEVMDNGTGIDENRMRQLKSMLHVSNGAARQETEAHGIGMLNVHQRIQLLYGEGYGIDMRSAAGRGTTVKVELPFILRSNLEGDGVA